MRQLSKVSVLLGLPLFLFAFQNCSQHEFNSSQSSVANQTAGDPTGGGDPGDPNTPVVRDPFGGGQCAPAGSGLAGQIYSYPNGVGVQNYIMFGRRVNALVILNNVNVPTRAFDKGFPTTSGKLLQDAEGNDLIEFFALDLRGNITLNSSVPAGDYQFALMSDDGAILDIDGTKIVDNDGTHSAQWKCATAPMKLEQNVPRSVRLRYYQGPRNHIAIQLLWRPWSKKGQACGESGEWSVVPASVLSH
jgi:hypothetical protein